MHFFLSQNISSLAGSAFFVLVSMTGLSVAKADKAAPNCGTSEGAPEAAIVGRQYGAAIVTLNEGAIKRFDPTPGERQGAQNGGFLELFLNSLAVGVAIIFRVSRPSFAIN